MMKHHRIFISTDGPFHNVLKIKPPIVMTVQEADRVVLALENTLLTVTQGSSKL
jgi:4-aminobutyrate aminotransferase-like enzyme